MVRIHSSRKPTVEILIPQYPDISSDSNKDPFPLLMLLLCREWLPDWWMVGWAVGTRLLARVECIVGQLQSG